MKAIFVALLCLNAAYYFFGAALDLGRPASVSDAVQVQPVDADPIRLLSELAREDGGDSPRQQEISDVISDPVIRDDRQSNVCVALGPFDDVFAGQNALEQILALDVPSELKAIDSPTGDSDFRVMIPPASSAEEAFRKLRELKSQNIDSYVLTQGPDALGISLGVFNTEKLAVDLLNKITRMGYRARLLRIPSFDREFWIFSTQGNELMLRPAIETKLEQQYPSVALTPQPCI